MQQALVGILASLLGVREGDDPAFSISFNIMARPHRLSAEGAASLGLEYLDSTVVFGVYSRIGGAESYWHEWIILECEQIHANLLDILPDGARTRRTPA